MAEVQWIKLVTNVFDNRKIRLIETMPEGDTIIVIWFKLLCMAGQTNDGGSVYFTKDIPFTDEMLSHVFSRPLQVIRLALKTFEQFGMIQVVDSFIRISSWEKYQNVEGLEKIREQTRLRVQKHREQKALEDSNVTVTLRNATEKNREEKKEDNKLYTRVIDHLNLVAGTRYKPSSKATQRVISARINEGFTIEDMIKVIDIKADDWKGTEFEKYLRPETLFGTKFEGYLNSKKTGAKSEVKFLNLGDDDD